MDSVSLSGEERTALEGLAADLRRVFGARLRSLAAYGLTIPAPPPRMLHTLALVDRLTFEDLVRCVPLADGWRRRSLAVPLVLELEEFMRTLDVFPLEYGDIIAHHVLIAGTDPFSGTRVAQADVRRACELSAKSHLIHLREAFLETGGESGCSRAPDRGVRSGLRGAASPHRTAHARRRRRMSPKPRSARLASRRESCAKSSAPEPAHVARSPNPPRFSTATSEHPSASGSTSTPGGRALDERAATESTRCCAC